MSDPGGPPPDVGGRGDEEGVELPEPLRAVLLRLERDAAVGRLLRGIAHDLNNPISSMSGFAELLSDSDDLPEQERRWAGIVRESADRAAAIARSLLAFGRQRRREEEPGDPVELVEGTLSLARLQLERRGLTTRFEWEEVPPPVAMDPAAFQHVVLNLLGNAADAMEAEGGGEVVLRMETGEGTVALEVVDRGPGIDPEVADRIFRPLVTTREDRAGLGLATARWMAEEAGGALDLLRTGEEGTAFRLTLPARREEEGGARALVVDRASELRMLARMHLEGLGFEVDEAGSVAEAAGRAGQESYAVILADVPDVAAGERLLAALGADERDRLLLTTGGMSAPPEREWLEKVGRPVLRKPYGKADLEELVRGFGDG